MTSDIGPYGTVLAILAMAAVTYAMRVGGFWLMGRVALTPRLRRILGALPGAVVIATVVPIIAREGPTAAIAIAAAGVVMVVLRNDFLAVLVGMATAALARTFVF